MTAGIISAALFASTPSQVLVAPTFIAAGSLQASTSSLAYSFATGGIDTSYQENDIVFALLQTSNETPGNTPAGWTYLTGYGSGTAGAAGSVGLHAAWARAGTFTSPNFGDSGDHTMGRVIIVRGCRTSGDPVVVLAGAADSQSDPIPIPVANTTINQCLVLHVLAHGQDISSAFLTSVTSAGLASVTEAFDSGTLQGNGGGIAMVYGVDTAAGSLGSPTADLISLSQPVVIARATYAFIPVGA